MARLQINKINIKEILWEVLALLKAQDFIPVKMELSETGVLLSFEKNEGFKDLEVILMERYPGSIVEILPDLEIQTEACEHILNQQKNGLVLLDKNDRVIYFNAQAARTFPELSKNSCGAAPLDVMESIVKSDEIYTKILRRERFSDQVLSLDTGFGVYNVLISGEKFGKENYILSFYWLIQLKKWLDIVTHVDESAMREIPGISYAIEQVKERCAALAGYDLPVLICGEPGTKKAQYGRLIHRLSVRTAAPFIMIDCSQIDAEICEREIFGYIADERMLGRGVSRPEHLGMLAKAEGGTLYIHKVECLSPKAQKRLLRFIQSGTYTRSGDQRSHSANVRIIVSADDSGQLAAFSESGAFSKALYSSLKDCIVAVPPLRERIEDIPSIVDALIEKYNRTLHKHIVGADRFYFSELSKYYWPGNDDELSIAVLNSINACAGDQLAQTDLFLLSEADRKERGLDFDTTPVFSEK